MASLIEPHPPPPPPCPQDAQSVLAGLVGDEDAGLTERVSVQLQAARLALHQVLFEWSVGERMALIAHSRRVLAERRQTHVREVRREEKRDEGI